MKSSKESNRFEDMMQYYSSRRGGQDRGDRAERKEKVTEYLKNLNIEALTEEDSEMSNSRMKNKYDIFHLAEEQAKLSSQEQLLSKLNKKLGYNDKEEEMNKKFVNESFNAFTKKKLNMKGFTNDIEDIDEIDLDETMKMFRRNEMIGDDNDVLNDLSSPDLSENLESSPDVDEYADDEEYLKYLDKIPQHIKDKYNTRWKKYAAKEQQNEDIPNSNVLNKTIDNIKKQLGPQGKSIIEKFEKYKNTEKAYLEQELEKCNILDETLKSSNSAFDKFGTKDFVDINFEDLSSRNNKDFFNNLFDEAVNKSTKANNQGFEEMSKILDNNVDDNLSKWLELRYPSNTVPTESIDLKKNDTTKKAVDYPDKRTIINAPSSSKKPSNNNNVKENPTVREKSKKTSSNVKKPWR